MARRGAGGLSARAALYYAPAATDPLWQAGCTWLGRDPDTGRSMPPAGGDYTDDPRLYGFHATLKPPMRLRYNWDALMEDAAALATTAAPFDLPPLAITDIGGFLALRETVACPALHALADRCVTELDTHRDPPDAAELARRRAGGLSPAQDAMLRDWGYPHVLSTWFFHMTLTRRLTPDEHATIRPLAEAHFASALAQPRRVDAVCLFTQAGPGTPFMLAERLPLRG